MARIRAYAAAVLAGLLLASCGVLPTKSPSTPTPEAASASPQSSVALEDVERSVVLIQMTWTGYVHVPANYSNSGEAFWSDLVTAYTGCTGFFVSEDAMIATAGHCVDPTSGKRSVATRFLTDAGSTDLINIAVNNWTVEGEQAGSSPALQITVYQPTNLPGAILTNPQTAQVLDFQPFNNGDNALLRIANMKGTPPLTLAQKAPSLGEAVTSIGFPGVISDVVDRTTINRASFKPGTISSKQTLPSGAPVIEVSTEIASGMSGGPTVNSANEVVGINSASAGEAGFNFITDTDDLRLFLQRNGIKA